MPPEMAQMYPVTCQYLDKPSLASYASVPEGRHRSLGTHISRVFSLTLDKWEFADYESWPGSIVYHVLM